MKQSIFCILVLILLAGCTGRQTATAILAAEAATQAPAQAPSLAATNTVQPTAKPTQKVVPTWTPFPIVTVWPSNPDDVYTFEQNRRIGRGVNLGNALEAPTEGEWGMTLEEGFFQIIKDGGFDSVRIPIRWSAHAQTTAPYTIDPAFLARVDWAVDQALKRDLVAIINMHHYEEIYPDPEGNRERFIAIWKQLAEHYRGYPDGLFFELLNEPNGVLANTDAWNTLVKDTLQVVRETNPKRMVVIGPGDWNRAARLDDLKLPEDDRFIIATYHYYEPFHFTHQGAEWAQDSNAWLGTKWTASAYEKSVVDMDFDVALKWSAKTQRPIYMGEFGAYSKADMESRHLWTDYIARAAEARGFSWAYWEFGSGFGVYDREKKAWVDPIYKALIP